MPVADTKQLRSKPLTARDRTKLGQLQRTIRAGMRAEQQRIALIRDLHQRGVAFDTIADACGVSREAIRRAVAGR